MRSLIRKLILEQVGELFDSEGEESKLKNDSIDDQIDAFIIKFEKDSIDQAENAIEPEDALSESLRMLSLSSLLTEQDDEGAEDEEEDVVEDAEEEEVAEESEPDEVIDVPKPEINIESFTKRVARMIINFDSLVDVKGIIVNRAMNYLQENYDSAQAEEMKEILDTQFDFDVETEGETPEAPFAAGAFAGGTGAGLGGGGGA